MHARTHDHMFGHVCVCMQMSGGPGADQFGGYAQNVPEQASAGGQPGGGGGGDEDQALVFRNTLMLAARLLQQNQQ